MAFPDKLLADDEKVMAHLHPHWITLVPATLWFIVLCAAMGLGIGYAPGSGTSHTVLVWIIVVVAVALICWLSLSPFLSWATSHYVITDRRVLIRRGVITHTGRDIALQRLTDVGFKQTLWDRIVNAGTLTLESAGENGSEVLENVPRSEQQQQLLNRLIEQDAERRNREAAWHQQQAMQYPPNQPGTQPPPGGQYPPPGGQYPPPGGQYPPPGGQYPPTTPYPPT
jgi:uncharacterized membrane protein YdbT with pleckstrin-like domain